MSEATGTEIVIVGDSAFAEIAYEYFTHDSPHDVVGFCVEEAYLDTTELFDLPIVPFESVENRFPPAEYGMFVAITYGQCNRLRERLYTEAKGKGYSIVSYVSSDAFVWPNVEIGDNCFVFEGNVVQPFVELGDNVILWSGNHIGHHSTISDHCFVASHVVVSGFVSVGRNCFLGVNATISNNTDIGEYCLIGADATILEDTDDDLVFGVNQTEPKPYTSREYFGINE